MKLLNRLSLALCVGMAALPAYSADQADVNAHQVRILQAEVKNLRAQVQSLNEQNRNLAQTFHDLRADLARARADTQSAALIQKYFAPDILQAVINNDQTLQDTQVGIINQLNALTLAVEEEMQIRIQTDHAKTVGRLEYPQFVKAPDPVQSFEDTLSAQADTATLPTDLCRDLKRGGASEAQWSAAATQAYPLARFQRNDAEREMVWLQNTQGHLFAVPHADVLQKGACQA